MHIQVPGIEGFKLPSAMREEAGYDVLPFVNNIYCMHAYTGAGDRGI